jgi:hypothetical protein
MIWIAVFIALQIPVAILAGRWMARSQGKDLMAESDYYAEDQTKKLL